MTSLDAWLKSQDGRCAGCGHHVKTQGHGRSCIGDVKDAALEAVNNSAPSDVKARVDRAILRVARLGQSFSANDLRTDLVGVPGPVVGGRFNALAKQGVIVPTGDRVPSNLGSTHGHELKVWRSAA